MFGHEKGSFTGAHKQTIGKVELAEGGTLFLDEIGDMPIALQAKMLRFLQERVIERVGGREEISVDVRVVCATNQNPADLIKEGLFREDLYYRVSEITINIPPFRDREEGRLILARTLLQKYASSRAARSTVSPKMPCRPSKLTPGPATSASSRTRSRARSSWPMASSLPLTTWDFRRRVRKSVAESARGATAVGIQSDSRGADQELRQYFQSG